MTEQPHETQSGCVRHAMWWNGLKTPILGHILGEASDEGWTVCHRCETVFDDDGPRTHCQGAQPVACHRAGCTVHV